MTTISKTDQRRIESFRQGLKFAGPHVTVVTADLKAVLQLLENLEVIDPPSVATPSPQAVVSQPVPPASQPVASQPVAQPTGALEPANVLQASEPVPTTAELEQAFNQTAPASTEPGPSETQPVVPSESAVVSETKPAVSETKPVESEARPVESEATADVVDETVSAETPSEDDQPES